MAPAPRASRPIARLLALLGLATAQWTRRLDISLPGGVASIVFEEADDPDAVAARFVRERGVTDGAGCTADAACVAARVAGALRAELARPMTTDAQKTWRSSHAWLLSDSTPALPWTETAAAQYWCQDPSWRFLFSWPSSAGA